MAKGNSRPAQWAAAVSKLREAAGAMRSAWEEANAAREELESLQSEYQEWLDNLPENLQQSPLGEKLDNVTGLSLDETTDLDELDSMADECENVELPQGFGRD